MLNLCAPSIIYLIFSITQILIDIYNGLHNTAVTKIIVTVMVTLLLNILCNKGLSVVAWFIVFIPFMLMTVIVGMLIYIFGTEILSDSPDYACIPSKYENRKDITIDVSGNILIYDPEYNPSIYPVYYRSPNIIIPNPSRNDILSPQPIVTNRPLVPYGSSSPAYQS